MEKVVLAIFAHPDDAELMCAGTLSLLKKSGWVIHIATLANGDKGTHIFSRNEIAAIRAKEALNSAEIIGGHYHCVGCEDLYVFYNRETINLATGLIRRIHPDIVFTASPDDYMIDHEITSQIVQTACFSAGIKNMEINDSPFEPIPFLYYCDPQEGIDKFGNLIKPSVYVDISEEMPIKEKMLSCHESQRSWLAEHHGMDEYILFMKRSACQRGKDIDTKYAEGFRQHLGHSFPKKNILKEILGDLVTVIDISYVYSNQSLET
jgi:LmbE family N-acetylglucosaminyl deacetylase